MTTTDLAAVCDGASGRESGGSAGSSNTRPRSIETSHGFSAGTAAWDVPPVSFPAAPTSPQQRRPGGAA